jgi:uncharacterized membrane protein YphA (DoxX/SURF4 family)
VVAAWPCNRNRQSVNGQEEWIDENENTLIAGVASSFIEALRADRFPLSNEQTALLGVFAVRAWPFLSAVADRFGPWGQFGQPNVAWGTVSRFVEYTGRLNSYLPLRMTLTLAVISTGAEILFGLLLLVGWHTRTAALLSGILLMAFGLAMALALGAKAPLDFSVFSAAREGPCF